jgi:hypothetical protein
MPIKKETTEEQQARLQAELEAQRQKEEDEKENLPDPFDGFDVLEDVPNADRGPNGFNYNWPSFPAPIYSLDGKHKVAAKVFTHTTSRKVIMASYTNYIARLEKKGIKDVPKFSTQLVKDAKDPKKIIGIRVARVDDKEKALAKLRAEHEAAQESNQAANSENKGEDRSSTTSAEAA